MTTVKAMICDWFKFMLSVLLTEPMTNMQKFTQWSSVFAYCIGGGTLLVCPQLWGIILQLHFLGRSEGYLRLIGLGVIVIGFLLIVAARSNQQGPTLGSVFARFVLVNAILAMLANRNMMPLSFALLFMGLDTTLALITLVIWCRETEGASVSLFLREIFIPIFKCHAVTSEKSTAAVFFVGLFQFFFWLVFCIRPDAAQNILHLDHFQGHSSGFLAGVFFTLTIHGWHHITDASAGSQPFVRAALFYRILLNVPVFVILGFVDQIERNLCIALLVFELCSFVVILVFTISFSKREVQLTEGDERTLLTPGDNE